MNTFNRRDFIKMAGTAAGGLVLSSGMLSAQRKGGDKVNVAVVGYGAEGEVLMNSLLKLPYLNFVAICDIWQPRCNYASALVMRTLKQKPARYTIQRPLRKARQGGQNRRGQGRKLQGLD